MSKINTIGELLSAANCQFQVYDLGRQINTISITQFNQIEQNQIPYPFPTLGHAHLAIVFHSQQNTSPFIWMVKLPLDERGLINLGARNHFIAIIIEALGKDLTKDVTEDQQQILSQNPYHFTPPTYKLAALHAIIAKSLDLPASRYYADVQQYFSLVSNKKQWQHIGAQGIADFIARLDEQDNLANLLQSYQQLPNEVIAVLLSTLEHFPLPNELIEAILASVTTSISPEILRAISSCSNQAIVKNLIKQILQQENNDPELLMVIVSRCYEALEEQTQINTLLEKLAFCDSDSLPLFAPMFRELVAMPKLRPLVFQSIRDPNRSNLLSKKIAHLFSAKDA